jgi:hypothetical protein
MMIEGNENKKFSFEIKKLNKWNEIKEDAVMMSIY